MTRGDLAFSLLNAVLGFDLFLFSNLVIGFFLWSKSVVTFFVTFRCRGNVTVRGHLWHENKYPR